MSNARLFLCVCSKIVPSLVILAAAGIPAFGQDAGTSAGVVDDWSHHRQMFSNPGTREDAEKNGTLDRWLKITAAPRYQLQQLKRSAVPADPDSIADRVLFNGHHGRPLHGAAPLPIPNPIEKDWSQSLGGVTTSLVSSLAATLSSSLVSSSSTITVDGQTFTASSPTASTQTGTFTGVPTSAQTVTITDTTTGNALVLNAIPAAGEGTATFSGAPAYSNTTVVGGVTYTWHTAETYCGTTPCVYSAGTAAQSAANLEAAINDNVSECGITTGGACFWNITAANANAEAAISGAVITISNTAAATIAFTSSTGTVTLDPPTGIGIPSAVSSNGCIASTGGYFVVGTSATTAASNLAAAIAGCNTAYAAVGLTASANGAKVTVSADTPGTTGATGISLAATLSDFTWAGTGLTGGTNGTDTATTFKYWNSTTGTTGAYDTGSQLATDLHTALAANTTVNNVVTTTAGTNQITFNTTHAGPYSISVTNFGAFSGVGTIGSTATPASVQPNTYPAKYGASLTSASCSGDFVVYPTGQEGSATAATIVAYTNLYSSCSGTVPSVAWAYNTGGGYAVTTSPILSEDGTEVIFVQSNGTNSQLVVLKWAASTTESLTSPDTLGTGGTNITTCTAPCMATVNLTSLDTYSAPYYVYPSGGIGGDVAFVGTNSGTLDKISGVLNSALGTPQSATLTGAGNVASPVYDGASGCVFVGDSNGFLYSVNSGISGGSVCTSGTFAQYGRSEQLGENGAGIFDGVLVDSSAETVYAFVGEAASASICTTAGANCLVEFAASTFASGVTNTAPAHSEPLGGASTVANPIYSGSFDNIYYTSANGVGNLYVVGETGINTSGASLYRVPIATGGVTSAAVSAAAVTSATGTPGNEYYPWPSPLSEFLNGTIDYAFFSVNRGAAGLGCTNAAGNGCILAFNITSTTVSQAGTGQSYITPGTNGCWATGGIVIDNSASVTSTGGSEIYFVDLNGIDAGGAGGATPTSANCTTGVTTSIQGVQAAQDNP
jgi:hypothetical protein